MTELLPQIYAIEVPMDAHDFKAEGYLKPYLLTYEYIGIEDDLN